MKILKINVGGITSGSNSDLIEANIFQDYDAVIIDPESLRHLYNRVDYYNRDENILTPKCGEILTSVNEKRREQVSGLLQRGVVVVNFMQPLRRCSYVWSYEGEDHWSSVTNYDWLLTPRDLEKELGEIKYAKGETIDYVDAGHPFLEYLNTRPRWLAYVDKDACKNWKILASAFGTHVVALVKRIGLGHIILLPSYYDYHNGELLERCIVKLLGDKELTPQPDWAKAILVPGQEELIANITKIDEHVLVLEGERQSLLDINNKLERWKYLLYEKGKHHLEPMVRDALALIGCNVETQPDKASDGAVICDYGIALLEVAGSEGTIKIDKLSQLTRNISSYLEKAKGKVKGILVGNPFCNEPIDNRPPKDTQKQLFPKELIENAEELSISVLLSTDLYQIVCEIITGKLGEKDNKFLQEKIFKGKGLVRLV